MQKVPPDEKKQRIIVLIFHVNPLMSEIISVLFTVIIITMQKHQWAIYFHSWRHHHHRLLVHHTYYDRSTQQMEVRWMK